jgi:hypothetical protein
MTRPCRILPAVSARRRKLVESYREGLVSVLLSLLADLPKAEMHGSVAVDMSIFLSGSIRSLAAGRW